MTGLRASPPDVASQADPLSLASWPQIADAMSRVTAHQSPATPAQISQDLDRIEHAAIGLLSPDRHRDDFTFSPSAFALPRVLRHRGRMLARADYWRLKKDRLKARLAAGDPPETTTATLLGLFLCTAVLEGPGVALGDFIRGVAALSPERYHAGLAKAGFAPDTISQWLAQTVQSDDVADQLAPVLKAVAAELPSSNSARVCHWVFAVCDTLFTPRMSLGVNDLVFNTFVVDALRAAARDPDDNILQAVAEIDRKVASHYVKLIETSDRFASIQAVASPLFHAIGVAARRRRQDGHATMRVRRGAPLRAGFVLVSDSVLAHTEAMITFLRGVGSYCANAVTTFVYVAEPRETSPELEGRLAALRVPMRRMPDKSRHAMVWLREAAAADGVTAVVFVSVTHHLAFAAGYGVAPVLIWWSLKYQGFESAGIDGYLSAENFFDEFRMIEGRRWRSCRASLPPLVDPEAAGEARRLRDHLGIGRDDIVLGCIGREEKMLDPRYADAIAAIMQARPNTRLIWTGRPLRSAQVNELLVQRGIGARCHFLGWIPNTKVTAELMDIYTDSFPFASGFTAFEAMAVGKPIVVLKTPEALETSCATSLSAVYDGRIGTPEDQRAVRALFTGDNGVNLLTLVDSVESYIETALKLIDDPAYRAACGAAFQTYAERYARNERRFAETMTRHLIDVVEDKAKQSDWTIVY